MTDRGTERANRKVADLEMIAREFAAAAAKAPSFAMRVAAECWKHQAEDAQLPSPALR